MCLTHLVGDFDFLNGQAEKSLSVFLLPKNLSSAFGIVSVFTVEESRGEKYFCDDFRNRAKALCANCGSG